MYSIWQKSLTETSKIRIDQPVCQPVRVDPQSTEEGHDHDADGAIKDVLLCVLRHDIVARYQPVGHKEGWKSFDDNRETSGVHLIQPAAEPNVRMWRIAEVMGFSFGCSFIPNAFAIMIHSLGDWANVIHGFKTLNIYCDWSLTLISSPKGNFLGRGSFPFDWGQYFFPCSFHFLKSDDINDANANWSNPFSENRLTLLKALCFIWYKFAITRHVRTDQAFGYIWNGFHTDHKLFT